MSSVTPVAGAAAALPADSPVLQRPYAYDPTEVLRAYGSSDDGLTEDVAAARLAEAGRTRCRRPSRSRRCAGSCGRWTTCSSTSCWSRLR